VSSTVERPVNRAPEQPTIDAVVVGAGFSGLYIVHKLRELGLTVQGIEAGDNVGGAWYWNRYPGAQTDTFHYLYCYTFDDELLADWRWTQRYPPQQEMLEYFDHVADRFDLRSLYRFGTRVDAARLNEATGLWEITTDGGEVVTARFFFSAVGPLSAPNTPPFPGIENFGGRWYHTARWPHEGVDFTGKRVAVIGTGSTGIQVIPRVAAEAAELTVFQRTPNYVVPSRNRQVTAEDEAELKERYNEILACVRQHPFSINFEFPTKSACEVSAAERERVYEEAWQKGGFHVLMDTFNDVAFDPEANETVAEFIRGKIREIVEDEDVARLLTPTTYPYGAKRPPAGTDYYETFNRDNVTLVDVSSDHIDRITESGVVVGDRTYEVDIIIFATGFDAATGALTRMDVRGRGGVSLSEQWESGPQTYLGLATPGFPNMLMVVGPQTPFATIPVLVEQNVRWLGELISYMGERGYNTVEASPRAAAEWTQNVIDVAELSLVRHGAKVNSWFTGANIEGKAQVVNAYFGGANNYFDICDGVAANDFDGFEFK
jgi:cation diffusion facilitator CzcD-associated flavoprotein CzcO